MTSVQIATQSKLRRLEQSFERLQREWDLWNANLGQLGRDLATETRSDEKFRLERQVHEGKSALDRLEESIVQVEQEISALSHAMVEKPPATVDSALREKLYIHLLALDFQEQQHFFEQVFQTGRDVAFLLQGERGYGQGWLLRQLLEIISQGREIELIQIPLESSSQELTLEALWYRLGKRLFDGANFTLSCRDHIDQLRRTVASEVVRQLQAQQIVLVLSDVDFTCDEFLNRLIVEFWQPLVRVVQQSQGHNDRFPLLLFLVDRVGRVKNWKKVTFIEQLDQTWEPSIPVKLPKIKRFTNRILLEWVRTYLSRVARRDVAVAPPYENVQRLLQSSSNGVPGEVLRAIYHLCGYDEYEWEEEFDRKWRLRG
ncbi:hypothetical protein ACKFKF_18310 [Phormidesmis sp. 146-12]